MIFCDLVRLLDTKKKTKQNKNKKNKKKNCFDILPNCYRWNQRDLLFKYIWWIMRNIIAFIEQVGHNDIQVLVELIREVYLDQCLLHLEYRTQMILGIRDTSLEQAV